MTRSCREWMRGFSNRFRSANKKFLLPCELFPQKTAINLIGYFGFTRLKRTLYRNPIGKRLVKRLPRPAVSQRPNLLPSSRGSKATAAISYSQVAHKTLYSSVILLIFMDLIFSTDTVFADWIVCLPAKTERIVSILDTS